MTNPFTEAAKKMQTEINGAVCDELRPGTLAFGLWKQELAKRMAKEHGLLMMLDWDTSVKTDGLLKAMIFFFCWYSPRRRLVGLAGRLFKIPHVLRSRYSPLALLKPRWWHKVGDHLFLIKRREKKPLMRAILLDYQLKKDWEPETTKLIEAALKPGDIALDIGASVGYVTLLCAKQVGPTGRVIAVEPTDFQFPYLQANIVKNGYRDRVTPFCVAAWDKDEMVAVPLNAAPHNKVSVQGRSMTSLLQEQGISKVDFIKIDTDGSEPQVLRGLIPVFEKNPSLKMVVEYYPSYVENAGGSIDEVMAILNKYFVIQKIKDDYDDPNPDKTNEHYNLFCTRKV